MRDTFIFASCKEWHRSHFERLRSEGTAQWIWVSEPAELNEAVSQTEPRYIFFLHWNWYVPTEVWSRHECVCFHMTDVPYGRGGSPLQNLIKEGHKETKLSALRMVEEMDAGPVYTKRSLSLAGRAEEIYRRAGELSVDVIRWMVANEPTPVPQQGDVVAFKRRSPKQSELPLKGTVEDVYDHIRMLDAPTYPLAYIDYGDFRLEFSNAQINGIELHAIVKLRKREDEHKE